MESASDNTLLFLTKEVLRQTSPKELMLADHFDPEQHSHGATAKGPLGFGVEWTIPLLLPIVYGFFEAFVGELKSGAENLGKKAANTLITKIAKAFEGKPDEDAKGDPPTELIQRYLTDQGIEKDRAAEVSKVIARVLDDNIARLKARLDDS